MSGDNQKNFNFYIPLDFYKGKEGEWRIKGIASTEDIDLQGEVVRQNSLDISPLKEGMGLFNWDHEKGPENVLGAIEDADIKENGLHVDGYLFKESDRAKSVYKILSSAKDKHKKRLKMSIEGKIYKRDGLDGKEIASARVDKVALTFDPVNPNTYAMLVKSLTASQKSDDSAKEPDEILFNEVEVKKLFSMALDKISKAKDKRQFSKKDVLLVMKSAIEKALGIGAGTNTAPSQVSGGAALTRQSLDSKKRRKKRGKK